MERIEVLVATMHQNDFSLIKKMNISSDVVFANQTDHTSFDEIHVDGFTAKMISTDLCGVGNNRNMALLYSSGDICLLADDDVVYNSDYCEVIRREFKRYPKADIIIFNFDLLNGNKRRKPKVTRKSYTMHRWNKNGFTTFRIAFRRSSFLKSRLFFSTIYGGGCSFPFGEDTLWIEDARSRGLNIVVSEQYIGKVDQSSSSWFDKIQPEAYFYGRGVYLRNTFPRTYLLWILLYYSHTGSLCSMPAVERVKWMIKGAKGFKKLIKFEDL